MMRITSDENSTRSMRSIALPVTQREEMQLEDRSIGLQAELNFINNPKRVTIGGPDHG